MLQGLIDYLISPATTAALVICGVVCGVKTRFVQVRRFKTAMLLPFCKEEKREGGFRSFSAAMTALSGTLGTGNIIGVAVSIGLGGAGAVFWMIAAAFLGMAVKYVEIYLSCADRVRDGNTFFGGPMVVIQKRLHTKRLAALFCILCIAASFGVGNLAQGNAVGVMIKQLSLSAEQQLCLTGILSVLFAGALYFGMRGGEKRITRITGVLTPIMAAGYLLGCGVLLWINRAYLPQAAASILQGAFGYRPAAGGFCGAVLASAVRTGVMRGLFTNECGLGSAPIVHAASGEKPHIAGLWGVFEVFFDTVAMCSITAMTLLTSNAAMRASEPYAMTACAFESVFGVCGIAFLMAALWLFALAAALGWGYYGSSCLRFLGRRDGIYAAAFAIAAAAGFFLSSDLVLRLSDFANGLMLLLHTGVILVILCAKRIKIDENQR